MENGRKIFDQPKVSNHQQEGQPAMYTQLSAPINVQWELTSLCNHKCVHCYNFWRDAGKHKLLPIAKTKVSSGEFVANELISNKVFHVTLTGGEPLIVINKYRGALEMLRDAGIQLGINSNLALLTTQNAKLLRELGVGSILTSLMASEECLNDKLAGKTGAFKKTIEGIHLAVKSGFRVAVNTVATLKNIHDIRNIANLVANLGAKAFCATKATKPLSCDDFSEYHLAHEDLNKMFSELLWVRDNLGLDVDSLEHYPGCAFFSTETHSVFGSRNCSAGKTGCTIGHDGDIRPCSHAHMNYGNIVDGLKKAWYAMSEWRDGSIVPEHCKKECAAFPKRCSGGCRIEAYNSAGKIDSMDPFCRGVQCAVAPLPRKENIDNLAIKIDDIITPCRNLRLRNESFGYIAYRSSKYWMAVDATMGKLLTSVRNNGGFTGKDLANAYNVSESRALYTLRLLILKKLVNVAQIPIAIDN